MAEVETVARIVRLNGGKLIGKTRLQKSAYFLEWLGVGFGLDFAYHHYGPYSEDSSISRMTRKRLTLSRSIGNYLPRHRCRGFIEAPKADW